MISYKLFAGNGASSSYLSILLSCIYNDFFSAFVAAGPLPLVRICYGFSIRWIQIIWTYYVPIIEWETTQNTFPTQINETFGHLSWSFAQFTIGGDGNMPESWISIGTFMKCSVSSIFSQDEIEEVQVVELFTFLFGVQSWLFQLDSCWYFSVICSCLWFCVFLEWRLRWKERQHLSLIITLGSEPSMCWVRLPTINLWQIESIYHFPTGYFIRPQIKIL